MINLTRLTECPSADQQHISFVSWCKRDLSLWLFKLRYLPSPTNSTIVPSATHTLLPVPKLGISIGAIVAAVVSILGLAAAIGIIWFLLQRRKARSQAAYQPANSRHQSPLAMEDLPPSYVFDPVKGVMVVQVTGNPLGQTPSRTSPEPPSQHERYEMLADRETVEAPGDFRHRYELPG